ncbi:hypothetical protein HC248_03330 [Polaromonas vacuolata]|uniref:DUF4390 domain-containing protein n=1 Tax=Polaromonas vacuolata TaxID=37448 RepID=A0A6H2HE13_9BURK|nr:DUF4390 domain-containing protein [Polaromonas vacuolata]QJC57997.1 hypothetical protein HC248_03330 [Polaromonas vacuolata]
MMAFITQHLKNVRVDLLVRRLRIFWLLPLLLCVLFSAHLLRAAELSQLKVESADDGIYLSALVNFELPLAVEDALLKGIPMLFLVEADIYRDRWYWTDRRVAGATRTIRLAFQPLTRRFRVNIVTGLVESSTGLRATLNQNYDSLPEALAAVQRLARWRIADISEINPDLPHKLNFSFQLDLSQLPRPFQIGVAGQKDWTISVSASERLQLERIRPPVIDKSKATP